MNKKFLAVSLVSFLALGSSCPTFAASKVVQTSEHSATAVLYSGANDIWEDHVQSIDGGDGEWRYGHRPSLTLGKYVYSDLDHRTKVHKSFCNIDADSSDSGWVPAKQTSKSGVNGAIEPTGYAGYDTKDN